LLRPATLIPVAALVVFLYLVLLYVDRRYEVPAGTSVYVDDRGNDVFVRTLREPEKARILRWDYGKYLVEFEKGERGLISQAALKLDNRFFSHFFAFVFSKNEKHTGFPLRRERHQTYYTEPWRGVENASGGVYYRLVFLFTFILAAPGKILKPIAGMVFIAVFGAYSLYQIGEENKGNYGNVSYFKQVSLRIPSEFKGYVFAPNTQWLIRIKVWLGMKNRVLMHGGMNGETLPGSYVVTPGGAGGGDWEFLYRNGPMNLYYVGGYLKEPIARIPAAYTGPVFVTHERTQAALARENRTNAAPLVKGTAYADLKGRYLLYDTAWGKAPEWLLDRVLEGDHLPKRIAAAEAGRLSGMLNAAERALFDRFYAVDGDAGGRRLDGQMKRADRAGLGAILRRTGYAWRPIAQRGPARLYLVD
jgi:hypothetical protein